MKWYREAAQQGSASSQYYLGTAYDKGQGVPQDHAEAEKWYRKAAEQGHAGAQCDLGVSYYNGQGVPQDYAEAVKWYRKAAEQGNAAAQFNLGVAYHNGQGVPRDYSLSYFWYSLSVSRSTGGNYTKRAQYRDATAKKLTSGQLKKAQQMTKEWEAKRLGK